MALTSTEIMGYEPGQMLTVKHMIKVGKETRAEENNTTSLKDSMIL